MKQDVKLVRGLDIGLKVILTEEGLVIDGKVFDYVNYHKVTTVAQLIDFNESILQNKDLDDKTNKVLLTFRDNVLQAVKGAVPDDIIESARLKFKQEPIISMVEQYRINTTIPGANKFGAN